MDNTGTIERIVTPSGRVVWFATRQYFVFSCWRRFQSRAAAQRWLAQ